MIEVLGRLTSDPRHLAEFLDSTGLQPGSLRARVADGTLRPALMHYLLNQEALLIEVASSLGRRPEDVAAAASQA